MEKMNDKDNAVKSASGRVSIYDEDCAIKTLGMMAIVPAGWVAMLAAWYLFLDPVTVCFDLGFDDCLKGHTRGAQVYFWTPACDDAPCFEVQS